MLVAEAMTISSLLADIGSIFTALIGYVGDIVDTITGNPLLLLGVCIPFVFAVITFVRKIFNIA